MATSEWAAGTRLLHFFGFAAVTKLTVGQRNMLLPGLVDQPNRNDCDGC